jgi:hypothetical protein
MHTGANLAIVPNLSFSNGMDAKREENLNDLLWVEVLSCRGKVEAVLTAAFLGRTPISLPIGSRGGIDIDFKLPAFEVNAFHPLRAKIYFYTAAAK